MYFKDNYFFQGSRGVQLFPGGVGEGGNCLFPIETHITCNFPGGSGPPPPSGSAHGLWHFLVILTLLLFDGTANRESLTWNNLISCLQCLSS